MSELISIPILDSLAHPSLSGKWLDQNANASFKTLLQQLTQANYIGACAIGMANLEGYQHRAFLSACRRYPNLYPVAGFSPQDGDSVKSQLAEIALLGYQAIKLHPRFSKLTNDFEAISETFFQASKLGLKVFYCTYMHGSIAEYPTSDPFYSLVKAIKQAPNVQIVLVHGGDINLLRYAELVRFNPNLILDLSLTIMKYPGSSLDQDIRFLFQHFDRRICIGTDFPEYQPAELRQRFIHFGQQLPLEKLTNIAHLNLERFLGVKWTE